ncbi:MAG: hypothetical protein KBA03_03990, partial [Anaerolineaceae bacterium]|nr:hypothetical protein [Anaerolineaceae bacterium]
MDKIDELFKMMVELDNSNSTQLLALIGFINGLLNDPTVDPGSQAFLTSLRTNLWLDLWKVNKEYKILESAINQIQKSLEKQVLSPQDIHAIGRVFYIFLSIHNVSKDSNILNGAIYWGKMFSSFADQDFPYYTDSLCELADRLGDRYQLSRNEQDLNESITFYEQAIAFTSEEDVIRP